MAANPHIEMMRLADDVNVMVRYMSPLFGLMYEQMEMLHGGSGDEARAAALETMYSLVNSAERYLGDVRRFCDQAQQTAKTGEGK